MNVVDILGVESLENTAPIVSLENCTWKGSRRGWKGQHSGYAEVLVCLPSSQLCWIRRTCLVEFIAFINILKIPPPVGREAYCLHKVLVLVVCYMSPPLSGLRGSIEN